MKSNQIRNHKRLILSILLCLLVLLLCYWILQLSTGSVKPINGWKTVNEELETAYAINEEEKVNAGTIAKEEAASDQTQTPKLINLNQATAEELDVLPGIGLVKAKAIIEYRVKIGKFQMKEDIMKVKGIGPKTFENIEQQITVAD